MINKDVFKKLLAATGLAGAIAGSTLLIPFEGKVNHVYTDPVNILTSCYGHTGPELSWGKTFTDEQCLEQLAKDITRHDRQLMGVVKQPLNVYEHAAYLSFVFNAGITTFSKSTMLGKLNAGNHAGACEELIKWVYAGKTKLKGLERRRQAEMDMCLGKVKIDDPEIQKIIQESME